MTARGHGWKRIHHGTPRVVKSDSWMVLVVPSDTESTLKIKSNCGTPEAGSQGYDEHPSKAAMPCTEDLFVVNCTDPSACAILMRTVQR